MRFRRKTRAGRPDPDVVLPPEGVPLRLEIAGLGARLGAQITDVLITGLAAGSLHVLLSALGLSAPRTLTALAMFLFFVIRIPYYVLAELAWNGQTLGKKLMKIKVVSHDGASLTTHAVVLRNLMKEAEIFLPGTLLLTLDEASPVSSSLALAWIVAVLAVPLMNSYRRRMGDLMAGTHVIQLPVPVLLSDVAEAVRARAPEKPGDGFAFLAHQLDHYGALELQTLEGILRNAERRDLSPAAHRAQRETLAAIVGKIRNKISYPEAVETPDHLRFLRAFYNAQRAHLEQRQLFGDRRADKFHGQDGTGNGAKKP
ncbi:MAG: RDD family protein [Silicimonas sp.]|nr:RDD family protein [Silicimonas sp.]